MFRAELQKFLGYTVPDVKIKKVVALAQRLFILQPSDHDPVNVPKVETHGDNLSEFGSDIIFHAPTRFLVDEPLENGLLLDEESYDLSIPPYQEQFDHVKSTVRHSDVDRRNVDLRWLREECDRIVRRGGSQLSGDELSMALCQVLDSDKHSDEVGHTNFILLVCLVFSDITHKTHYTNYVITQTLPKATRL